MVTKEEFEKIVKLTIEEYNKKLLEFEKEFEKELIKEKLEDINKEEKFIEMLDKLKKEFEKRIK